MNASTMTPDQLLAYYEGQELALSWALHVLDGKFTEDRDAGMLERRLHELRMFVRNIKRDNNL